MQTICFILIVLSVLFIVVAVKGLRNEATILTNLYYQQRLGFNKDVQIKEHRSAVNSYIAVLIFIAFVDVVFLNVLFN